jgi:ubiquinone/menaquinone biosynthesis C-methylase UbiE
VDDERRLLDEQIAYYGARAPEYDRTARPPDDPLANEGEAVRTALREFAPSGRVLELACGTGNWTGEPLRVASEVTALDASAEMLARARHRHRDERIRFVEADVFEWVPDGSYDVVFFTFWLSHVPPTRFEEFWGTVSSALAPEGRVFFVDEGRHEHWLEEWDGDHVVTRRLSDGSVHRAVKVFYEPSELEARLRELGWAVTVEATGALYWGAGGRARA